MYPNLTIVPEVVHLLFRMDPRQDAPLPDADVLGLARDQRVQMQLVVEATAELVTGGGRGQVAHVCGRGKGQGGKLKSPLGSTTMHRTRIVCPKNG